MNTHDHTFARPREVAGGRARQAERKKTNLLGTDRGEYGHTHTRTFYLLPFPGNSKKIKDNYQRSVVLPISVYQRRGSGS